VWRSLLLAFALLPGLAAPAVAQGAGTPPEIVKHITDVASADSAFQEAAAVALGKTGDRRILPLLEKVKKETKNR
jgi:HEAT repeat protein